MIYADTWSSNWAKAVESCNNKQFLEAEVHFTQAIELMEKEGNLDHPHIHVDRARLYSLLNRNEEALVDLNKAFDIGNLEGDDKLRAVVTRLITYYRLQMFTHAQEEVEVFKSIYSIPKLEVYKDLVIVRDVPDCDCARQIMKKFISEVFCDSEEDVQLLPSGICIAKRACDCKCNEKQLLVPPPLASTECEWYCDKAAKAEDLFCAGSFKVFKCQAMCVGAVEFLKEGCYWCCREGGFYKRCVKPFENIVGAMGNTCDPEWD